MNNLVFPLAWLAQIFETKFRKVNFSFTVIGNNVAIFNVFNSEASFVKNFFCEL